TLAAQWQALLILALFMAPTFNIVDSILPKSREATARGHFTALARDTAFGTALVALRVVLMAHSAWMMGDAIVRTLYRMIVSRQNLHDGRTAPQAHQSLRHHRAHALPHVRLPAEPARMAHRLAGAQGGRQQPRLLLFADVRGGDHRPRRPDDPGARRFHRRLRRLFLLRLLGRLAGLRLAD